MSARVRPVATRRALTGRMIRTRPAASLLVALLALVLGAAAAAVPVSLQGLADRTAREAVAGLAPGARDLTATGIGVPQSSGDADPWSGWNARLDDLRAALEPPLGPLLADPATAVRLSLGAAQAGVSIAGGDGRNTVELLLAPTEPAGAQLVAGEWPVATPSSLAVLGRPGDGAPVQIALSEETADALEWPVGEVRDEAGLVLTGVFAQAPGSDDYWYHVPSVIVPQQEFDSVSGDRIVTGAGFLAPGMLDVWQGTSARTTVWYPFDAAGVDAADTDALLQQLRQFTANAHIVGTQAAGTGGLLTLSFDTTAVDAVEEALATTAAMRAVVALSLSAPAGAAVVVLVLACRVVARSRRPALALLATRGASPALLRGLLAAHGAVLGVVPALLGAGAAVVVGASHGVAAPAAAWAAATLVAVLPAGILALAPPPAAGLRDDPRAALGPRARLVAEAAVVALALLATAALVSAAVSGTRLGAGADTAAGADLLAAAVPLLWALVGCVIALRLVPLPVAAVRARARRGPALVGFLGASRFLRDPAAGALPVLALVLGMSSAVASGVLYGSIQHAVDAAARTAVGADLQIARAALSPDDVAALRGVAGVDAVAPISSLPAVYLRAGAGAAVEAVSVTVLFADPAELAAAQDAEAPLLPAGADLAAAGDVPVVVSPRVAAQVSDDSVRLEQASAVVVGTGVARSPAGISDSWVLVDDDHVEQVAGRRVPATTAALVAFEPGADAAAATAAVRDIVGADAVVTTPAQRSAQLSGSTGAAAIRVTLLAAATGAAALGALAVVLTLALGSRARERTLAVLRVLGASPRAGWGLIVWELWPAVAAALVVGVAVGLALPTLVLAAVDLSAFSGAVSSPDYHLDPLLLVAAIAGFLAITAAVTALGLAVSRRVRSATLLRAGQEG